MIDLAGWLAVSSHESYDLLDT